jgi:predicted secreted Zn-dependent protease
MKVKLNIPKSPKEVPYAVKGKTIADAAEFIRKRDTAACYTPNPNYSFGFDGDQCNALTITAAPTVKMPNWAGASKLKGQEKKDWDSMIAALKKHEATHHTKWEKAAKDFKKAREKEGDFPKSDVASVMSAFFTKAQKVMDSYDSKTNHGIKEGVTLPY